MNKTNNGRWIKQLTDEMIEELLKKVFTSDKLKSFKRIIKISRTESEISVFFALNVKSYMSYAEKTVKISDFKMSTTSAETIYPEFMIKNFGEEYANEFLAYANDYVKKDSESSYAKRLTKVVDKIPAMVDKYNQEQVQTV